MEHIYTCFDALCFFFWIPLEVSSKAGEGPASIRTLAGKCLVVGRGGLHSLRLFFVLQKLLFCHATGTSVVLSGYSSLV
jgi:hypothetical protein